MTDKKINIISPLDKKKRVIRRILYILLSIIVILTILVLLIKIK